MIIYVIVLIVICGVLLMVRAVIQNIAYRKQLKQYRQQMQADGIESIDVSHIGTDGKMVKEFIERDSFDGDQSG